MTTSLNPIDIWEDKVAYKGVANNLNNLFKENYTKSSSL
tara:strand:+ start:115 stop:231 length:117 start_codon:yes stop_codon:yes gene_type:complete